MVRPRWQGVKPRTIQLFWNRWDQALALIAAINLIWVIFDVTYIPFRNFWLQRTLYPLPSINLALPLPWLPDITPLYDPLKGIEAHRDTTSYIEHFRRLEATASKLGINSEDAKQLRLEMIVKNSQLVDENPFTSSGNVGAFEKLKNRLRARAEMDSAQQAAAYLLSDRYLKTHDWKQEQQFWNTKILPLAETNYWRGIDANGMPIDLSWKIDIPFQILFLLDILVRAIRLKRRFPAIAWSDAFLRRWIDLPLLIPFWRLLRVVPVTERLSHARLLNLEPLRAAVSRGVVAVLALELFEVITLRVLDAMQGMVRSPNLPDQILRLCSHQTIDINEERELAELVRLWLPLILTQVGPGMRPQLVALFGHALQRNLDGLILPAPLRDLPGVQKAESELSRQLAKGMVDSLLGLSKSAGDQLGQKDLLLEDLGIQTLDRFWEELARTLEQGVVLERSQELLVAFLEDFKRTSMVKLRTQGGVEDLITELDGLNFNPKDKNSNLQA